VQLFVNSAMQGAGQLFEAHLGRQFDHFDGDLGGELGRSELLNLLNSLQLRLSLLEVKNLREQIDANASGTISHAHRSDRQPSSLLIESTFAPEIVQKTKRG
jgi:hypothetical protein